VFSFIHSVMVAKHTNTKTIIKLDRNYITHIVSNVQLTLNLIIQHSEKQAISAEIAGDRILCQY